MKAKGKGRAARGTRGRRAVEVPKGRGLLPVAGVFLLAVLVRGVYLCESSDNPTFWWPVVDSLAYDQAARGIVQGEWSGRELFWQPVFYPLFLSAVYWLSHSSILCAKIVQVLLGGMTCVLAYRLGERTLGRRTGVLAGAIVALYGPLIFFEGELLATGWAAFWSVALVVGLVEVRARAGAWR